MGGHIPTQWTARPTSSHAALMSVSSHAPEATSSPVFSRSPLLVGKPAHPPGLPPPQAGAAAPHLVFSLLGSPPCLPRNYSNQTVMSSVGGQGPPPLFTTQPAPLGPMACSAPECSPLWPRLTRPPLGWGVWAHEPLSVCPCSGQGSSPHQQGLKEGPARPGNCPGNRHKRWQCLRRARHSSLYCSIS